MIHGFDWTEVQTRLEDAVTHQQATWIVTANPEILLHAKREPGYWQTVRQADLRLVDGFGLQLVGWLFQSSPSRLTGVKLTDHLLKQAQDKGWKVAFVGGGKGVADKAAWKMREVYPTIRIIAEEGGRVTADGMGDETNDEMLQRLTQEAPDILLVAFGHPKQEAWITRHLAELPSVKIAVGVGGTFDYWAGEKKRAPAFLQTLGLEWLWRVFQEPTRIQRILDAVFVFPYSAIRNKALDSAKK